MGEGTEGKDLVKIAIGVILLLVVVSVVVALVMMGQNKANSATNDLANSMDQADMLRYDKYNNNEVTGADVVTAVKSFQGQDLKVFIANKGGNGGTAYVPATLTSISGAVQEYGYCATSGTSTAPVFDDVEGKWTAEIVPDNVANVTYNTNLNPISDKNSSATYVRQNGRYYAYLVYDKNTGDMCGLLFVQTK